METGSATANINANGIKKTTPTTLPKIYNGTNFFEDIVVYTSVYISTYVVENESTETWWILAQMANPMVDRTAAYKVRGDAYIRIAGIGKGW